jgi:hypothetical protein
VIDYFIYFILLNKITDTFIISLKLKIMKNINKSLGKCMTAFILIFLLLYTTGTNAASRSAVQSGNWSATSTWAGGVVPGSGDNVTISGDYTVTVDVNNASCASVVLGNRNQGSGILTFVSAGSPSLSINGSLTFGSLSASTGVKISTGTLTMASGATLTCTNFIIGAGGFGGYYPDGTIIFTGTNPLPSNISAFKNLTINGGATTLGVATAISGNLNIISGTFSSAASSFNISIAGNFTNNGIFTSNSNTVTFNGISQSISGTGSIIFYNVTLNSGGVSLSNSITISNNLSFTAGKITLGTNKLTISPGGTITGFNSSNYVLTNSTGCLEMQVSHLGGTVFPVGDGYNPLIIAPAIDATFDVSVSNIITDNGGTTVSQNVVGETWTVKLLSGNQNVSITTQWNSGDELPSFNRYNCHLASRNSLIGGQPGSIWLDFSTGSPASGTDPYTQTGTITSFSSSNNYYIGIGDNLSPLPVELISFAGKYTEGSVALSWATASEINNSHFEIQRSENGLIFSPVASVQGAGNSNKIINYSFTDDYIAYNALYYRLKQVDFNGNFAYSNIAVVSMGYNAGSLAIYPNPAQASDLHIVFPSAVHSNVNVQICDMNGKCIYNNFAFVEGSIMNLDINPASGIKTGLYIVIINSDKQLFRQTISLK